MNKYYESFKNDENFWQMTAFDETGVVGHLIMRFTDEQKAILRLGFIIVDSEKRGKGYGKGMLKLALQFAFQTVKVSKVTLGVFDNNQAAYHAYRSVGFYEVSAESRERYLIKGEEWECIEMEIGE